MRVEKDINLVLDFIVKESARIVNADRASLFLYDLKNKELWSKFALGMNEIIRFPILLHFQARSNLLNISEPHPRILNSLYLISVRNF